MKKKQFELLEIETTEYEHYNLPNHSHTYYEIIYIAKGSGMHHLNSALLPYKCGDLFLVSPEDRHHLVYSKQTKLVFIKFTDNYFLGNRHLSPDIFASKNPLSIMRKQLFKEEKLIFGEPCKTILRKTIENILSYNCQKDVSTSPIVFYQILSIFGIIEEAAAKLSLRIDDGMPNKEDLITYVHQHIYTPEKIRIKHIAGHFNISANYFSAYFKSNFGISLREYVNDYRMRLIEKRLEAGQSTIKQIAYEFGFADESHLSNYFSSRKKIAPGSYKQHQTGIARKERV
ncbi:MAG: AraC family transcriptional regulator [Breznakibacter sp.]